MADEPTGLWLIGARGSVAPTAARGLPAPRAGRTPVTERPDPAGVTPPGRARSRRVSRT
ncbi:hypothetical protein ABTZ99_33710 [Actinosynnema sp. NPDC002837]